MAQSRYLPYGQERWTSGAAQTDFTFTGQRADNYTHLIEMGARWYDPQLGRWASADSIVPQSDDPQSLNRYSYAYNNVLNHVDPTGHYPCEDAYGRCQPPQPHRIEQPNQPPQPPQSPQPLPKQDSEENAGFVTSVILQLPGTSEDWNNAARTLDTVALVLDTISAGAVTVGGISGAAVPAVLCPAGTPEVPAVTGLAGMGIAELCVQPIIQRANVLASLATGATLVSDTKAGDTRLEQGILGTNMKNSLTTTVAGWLIPEAYISTGIQALSTANSFGWVTFPWPK